MGNDILLHQLENFQDGDVYYDSNAHSNGYSNISLVDILKTGRGHKGT